MNKYLCRITERTKGLYRVKKGDKLFEIKAVTKEKNAKGKKEILIIWNNENGLGQEKFDKYGNKDKDFFIVRVGYPVVSAVVYGKGDGYAAMIFKTESWENKQEIIDRAKRYFESSLYSLTFHEEGDGL